MTNEIPILILGSGISGLIAAYYLSQHGVGEPVVLDKGTVAGGRLATCHFAGGVFDYGAPFFSARHPDFKAVVQEWLERGIIKLWYSHTEREMESPRYCGVSGMEAIPNYLASHFRVKQQISISHIYQIDQHWELEDEQGTYYATSNLILTPPVSQSLHLLNRGGFRLLLSRRALLESIHYHPCLVVLARLSEPSHLPAPGVLLRPHPLIAWMGDNQQKGISTVPAVTLYATPEFSARFYDASDRHIADQLLNAVRPLLGVDVEAWHIKRWRYSLPQQTFQGRCFVASESPKLILAGDAFGSSRVEGAVLSGLAAAKRMLENV